MVGLAYCSGLALGLGAGVLMAFLLMSKHEAANYPFLCRKHCWGYADSENTPCPICNRHRRTT